MTYNDEEIQKMLEDFTEIEIVRINRSPISVLSLGFSSNERALFGEGLARGYRAGFHKAQDLYEEKLKEQLQMINEMYCSK